MSKNTTPLLKLITHYNKYKLIMFIHRLIISQTMNIYYFRNANY